MKGLWEKGWKPDHDFRFCPYIRIYTKPDIRISIFFFLISDLAKFIRFERGTRQFHDVGSADDWGLRIMTGRQMGMRLGFVISQSRSHTQGVHAMAACRHGMDIYLHDFGSELVL